MPVKEENEDRGNAEGNTQKTQYDGNGGIRLGITQPSQNKRTDQ